MPPNFRTIRRPASSRIPRAIPVAEPTASRTAKAATPQPKVGWQPAPKATTERRGLLSALGFRPAARPAAAARTPPDAVVKSYGKYQSMSQLDYANERLGNGNKTIASHGCFLTSMAMASSGLTGKRLDPSTANRLVKAGNGFAGGALEAPLAARALGMKLVDRRAMTNGNAEAMRTKLDGWLASGKPAIAGVDLHDGRSTGTGGSDADHFIVIVDKNKDGTYAALDPLGGKRITLQVNDQGRLVSPRIIAGVRPYRVDELAFMQVR